MLQADGAHDLKIAVQLMISCAQLIQGEVEEAAPRAREYARLLVENGQQAVRCLQAALAEDCADYFALHARWGDATQAVRAAAERFRPQAEAAGLALEIFGGEAEFPFDGEKLTRVTMNLLSNALRHARARVRVRAERKGRWFLLAVEDDGPGLAGDPFSRPFQGAGSGIGLAEVGHFAALHGGRVQASRRRGWTRFAVELPADVGIP